MKALLRSPEEYDGWNVNRRSPRIGDVGTVLDVLAAPHPREERYVVECSGADGVDEWLGDFMFEELELVGQSGASASGRAPAPKP